MESRQPEMSAGIHFHVSRNTDSLFIPVSEHVWICNAGKIVSIDLYIINEIEIRHRQLSIISLKQNVPVNRHLTKYI